MEQQEVKALKEFLTMAERVRDLLVTEGLLPPTATVQEMSDTVGRTVQSLGHVGGATCYIVFIDYLYSMGGYKAFQKPHITLEWLVTEATLVITHAKSQASPKGRV